MTSFQGTVALKIWFFSFLKKTYSSGGKHFIWDKAPDCLGRQRQIQAEWHLPILTNVSVDETVVTSPWWWSWWWWVLRSTSHWFQWLREWRWGSHLKLGLVIKCLIHFCFHQKARFWMSSSNWKYECWVLGVGGSQRLRFTDLEAVVHMCTGGVLVGRWGNAMPMLQTLQRHLALTRNRVWRLRDPALEMDRPVFQSQSYYLICQMYLLENATQIGFKDKTSYCLVL